MADITYFVDRIAPYQILGFPVKTLTDGKLTIDHTTFSGFPKNYNLKKVGGVDFFDIDENFIIGTSGGTVIRYVADDYVADDYVETIGGGAELVSGYTFVMDLDFILFNDDIGSKTYEYDEKDIFKNLLPS